MAQKGLSLTVLFVKKSVIGKISVIKNQNPGT